MSDNLDPQDVSTSDNTSEFTKAFSKIMASRQGLVEEPQTFDGLTKDENVSTLTILLDDLAEDGSSNPALQGFVDVLQGSAGDVAADVAEADAVETPAEPAAPEPEVSSPAAVEPASIEPVDDEPDAVETKAEPEAAEPEAAEPPAPVTKPKRKRVTKPKTLPEPEA